MAGDRRQHRAPRARRVAADAVGDQAAGLAEAADEIALHVDHREGVLPVPLVGLQVRGRRYPAERRVDARERRHDLLGLRAAEHGRRAQERRALGLHQVLEQGDRSHPAVVDDAVEADRRLDRQQRTQVHVEARLDSAGDRLRDALRQAGRRLREHRRRQAGRDTCLVVGDVKAPPVRRPRRPVAGAHRLDARAGRATADRSRHPLGCDRIGGPRHLGRVVRGPRAQPIDRRERRHAGERAADPAEHADVRHAGAAHAGTGRRRRRGSRRARASPARRPPASSPRNRRCAGPRTTASRCPRRRRRG